MQWATRKGCHQVECMCLTFRTLMLYVQRTPNHKQITNKRNEHPKGEYGSYLYTNVNNNINSLATKAEHPKGGYNLSTQTKPNSCTGIRNEHLHRGYGLYQSIVKQIFSTSKAEHPKGAYDLSTQINPCAVIGNEHLHREYGLYQSIVKQIITIVKAEHPKGAYDLNKPPRIKLYVNTRNEHPEGAYGLCGPSSDQTKLMAAEHPKGKYKNYDNYVNKISFSLPNNKELSHSEHRQCYSFLYFYIDIYKKVNNKELSQSEHKQCHYLLLYHYYCY